MKGPMFERVAAVLLTDREFDYKEATDEWTAFIDDRNWSWFAFGDHSFSWHAFLMWWIARRYVMPRDVRKQ